MLACFMRPESAVAFSSAEVSDAAVGSQKQGSPYWRLCSGKPWGAQASGGTALRLKRFSDLLGARWPSSQAGLGSQQASWSVPAGLLAGLLGKVLEGLPGGAWKGAACSGRKKHKAPEQMAHVLGL